MAGTGFRALSLLIAPRRRQRRVTGQQVALSQSADPESWHGAARRDAFRVARKRRDGRTYALWLQILLQQRPMLPQPVFRLLGRRVLCLDDIPEARGMVRLDEVDQFVDDDIVDD
jgi:hypothetical protein